MPALFGGLSWIVHLEYRIRVNAEVSHIAQHKMKF
jgi:hypothetical protein